MEKAKGVIYIVTYIDDMGRKHITSVTGFSSVRRYEERYDYVYFERTDNFFIPPADELIY